MLRWYRVGLVIKRLLIFRFDSITGITLLCSWERHLTLISQAAYSLWWPAKQTCKQNPPKGLSIGVVRQTQSAWLVLKKTTLM